MIGKFDMYTHRSPSLNQNVQVSRVAEIIIDMCISTDLLA